MLLSMNRKRCMYTTVVNAVWCWRWL